MRGLLGRPSVSRLRRSIRDPPAGGPGGATRYVNPADAPLVQIPGTGTIFKICPAQ
jgi:hypothetical protein